MYESHYVAGHLYIFEEQACGGDLFSYLTRGPYLYSIPEDEALLIIYQLLSALLYLHNDLQIMHRDLKLDNVLMSAPMPACKILLCDFGAAKCLNSDSQTARSVVGTVEYGAPEIYENFPEEDIAGYTNKCDSWSVGVISHIVLSGISPFIAEANADIIAAAKKGILDFSVGQWKAISADAQDFVAKLLLVDAEKRLDTKQAFCHPWIAKKRGPLESIYAKITQEF